MRKSLSVVIVVLALTCLFAGIAFADEGYSANGTITSVSGNYIVFSAEGDSLTLSITEDTEISGELKAGADAYVEWSGNTAQYIEVEESGKQDEE